MPVWEPHELPELKREFALVAEGLDRFGPHEDAWAIERAALWGVPAMIHPDTPAELTELFVEAFIARGDSWAAAALTAFARLSHDPLATAARAAGVRLWRNGLLVPHDDDIGGLRVQQVIAHDMDGEALAYTCLLQRPGTPEVTQGCLVIFEIAEGCRRLIEIELVAPEPIDAGRRRLAVDLVDPTPRPSDTTELVQALDEAMRSETATIPESFLFDLALLERALTGADLSLPRPPIFFGPDEEEEARASMIDQTGHPSRRPPAKQTKARRQQAKAARRRNRRR
jgi:hypothetical protein